MVTFEPTAAQREDAAIKASGRLSQEAIAQSIINPRTGKPITVKTLLRVFRRELKDTDYKKRILDKFWEKVDAGEWPAIKYGMDNILGFGEKAVPATAATTNVAMIENRTINILPVKSPWVTKGDGSVWKLEDGKERMVEPPGTVAPPAIPRAPPYMRTVQEAAPIGA